MLKFCPNCEKDVNVKYEGIQHGFPVRLPNGKLAMDENGKYILKSIELYTCNECYSTFTSEG